MGVFYANAMTGSDANSGLTEVLAKRTWNSVYAAATNGDTIFLSGVFRDTGFSACGKSLWIVARNFATLDGSFSGGSFSGDYGTFVGITFRNFIYGFSTGAANVRFQNCSFLNNTSGFYGGYESSQTFLDCIFANNANAGFFARTDTGIMNAAFRNCVFARNGGSAIEAVTSSSQSLVLNNCVLYGAIMCKFGQSSLFSASSADNCYDFSAGKHIVAGVDRTTLAAWQSVINGGDARSVDRNVLSDLGDISNGSFRANPASVLLTAGVGSSPVGLTLPAVTISNFKNQSSWTGGVFSGTEIDGNGYLVLAAGETSGYWRSGVIDFGASIQAKSFEVYAENETATQYLDYDTADSPGMLTARLRCSNTAFLKDDVAPSWVVVPRGAEIGSLVSNGKRYWQLEITMRGT
jgi:hypothetical protein